GERYIIACADDPRTIAEVTQRNNCVATNRTFTVKGAVLTGTPIDYELSSLGTASSTASLAAKRSFTVREVVRARLGRITTAARPRLAYSLSPVPGPDDDEASLDVRTVGTPQLAAGGRSQAAVRRLTLPARVPPGSWYLRACIRGREDARGSND